MIQAMQYKEHITNEYLMKRYTNQFKLSLIAIKKAVGLVKSGAVDREGIINVAADVLDEIGEEEETKE